MNKVFFIIEKKDDKCYFLLDICFSERNIVWDLWRVKFFTSEIFANLILRRLRLSFPLNDYILCDSFSQLISALSWNREVLLTHG